MKAMCISYQHSAIPILREEESSIQFPIVNSTKHLLLLESAEFDE
jgi:hypothetical protein